MLQMAVIAPTMWHSYMILHTLITRGVFPGKVPDQWLDEQNLSVCNHCQQLVAKFCHMNMHYITVCVCMCAIHAQRINPIPVYM